MDAVARLPLVLFRRLNADARHWQILALGGLFALSFLTSDFGVTPASLVAAFAGAFAAQLIGTAWLNRRSWAFSPGASFAGSISGSTPSTGDGRS